MMKLEILNIEREIKRASYFKEEAVFNYGYYTEKIHTMFQHLTKIGSPINL